MPEGMFPGVGNQKSFLSLDRFWEKWLGAEPSHPKLYEARFTKLFALMLLQRYGAAAPAYQFAAQLKPDSWDAWLG